VAENHQRTQLITLHTRVLLQLIENPRISQEGLARRLDVTMRTAQRHLNDLEDDGYIVVNRERRPFVYSVNWTRTWPHLGWLRLVAFHPDVEGAQQGLSDVAARIFDVAIREGRDPGLALSDAFLHGAPTAGPV
jgi:predicted transcriptional regulator